MTVSVAMCTYNGARYLREQLDSIAAQTRLPDELVVCDDRSTDTTPDILRNFAAAASFPVRVAVNESNLGSTRNFEKAIGLCSGDIIALADQDDVWRPEKLARFASIFGARSGVGLVFSDAEMVDQDLRLQGDRLWLYANFTPEKQRMMRRGRAFDVQMTHNVVTGAAMAFRSSLRGLALPVPDGTDYIHDGWIALMAASVSDVVFLPEPLIQYRLHPQQQLGVRGSPVFAENRRQFVRPKAHYESHLQSLRIISRSLSANAEFSRQPRVSRHLRRLSAWMKHLEVRIGLPDSRVRRLPMIVRELVMLRYHRYSNGFHSAVRDLL